MLRIKKTCSLNNFNPSLSEDLALCKNSAGAVHEFLIPLSPPGQMEADWEAIRSTWPWRTASAQLKIPSVCQGRDTKGKSAHAGNSLTFLEWLVNWFIQAESHCFLPETTYLTDKQVNTDVYFSEFVCWRSSVPWKGDICLKKGQTSLWIRPQVANVLNCETIMSTCSQFYKTPTLETTTCQISRQSGPNQPQSAEGEEWQVVKRMNGPGR